LKLPRLIHSHDCLAIYDRQVIRKVFRGIVEDFPYGGIGPSHHLFHSVGRPYEMAFVDSFGTSGADKDIFVVIGHSHYLMGNDLSEREDQVKSPLHEQLVDLGRPGIVHDPFRYFLHKFTRYIAQGHYIVAPVMVSEQLPRGFPEHVADLVVCHGRVGPQSGQDIGELAPEVFEAHLRQFSGTAGQPREIGRYGQHLLPETYFLKCPV